MRPSRWTRVALGAALVVALGGCGSGGGAGASETLTVATSRGLTYTLNISASAKQQCTTTDVRASLAGGRTVHSSSHTCGPPIPGGHPLLIQARSSPESLVVDVPVTGCGTVRGGPSHAALHPLRTRCSERRPRFRVTIVPAEPVVVLVGVPGAPVINFARHRCRIICISALG